MMKRLVETIRTPTGLFHGFFPNTFFINPSWNLKPRPHGSTKLAEHPIFHENIHRIHYKKNRKINQSDTYLDNNGAKLATQYVSEYSVKHKSEKQEICEFVAEVGAALTAKIKFPKEIMDIYKKYDGPMPNEKI